MSVRAENKVSKDDLGHMSENELYYLFKKLDSYLERLGRTWWNSKDSNLKNEAKSVEVDLCYVIRELNHRKARSKHHSEYIQQRNNNKS